jgi:hypothetical protein
VLRSKRNESLGLHRVVRIDVDVNALQHPRQHHHALEGREVLPDALTRTGAEGEEGTGVPGVILRESLGIESLRLGPQVAAPVEQPRADAHEGVEWNLESSKHVVSGGTS